MVKSLNMEKRKGAVKSQKVERKKKAVASQRETKGRDGKVTGGKKK